MENNDIFSQSELIIRNYVLNQKENIMSLTVNEIASSNFVSKSTLTRFSQKLGFSGWNEFKLSFLKELNIEKITLSDVDYNFPFTETDSPLSIANKLQIMKKDTISHTYNLLDVTTLRQSLELLCSQDHIHIFGEGYSLITSTDFCYRMIRIGKHVSNSNEMGMSYIARTLNKKDLAIVVSYSGRTRSVLNATSILKKNNVPILSITTREDNPISELSDISLYLPTKEDLYSKIANYSTVDSMRFIFDILFSIYFNTNYNLNLNKRISIARVVDKKNE